MTTRRAFTLGLLGAGAGLGWRGRARPTGRSVSGPPGRAGGATPAGELAERIALSAHRMTRGGVPEFTREFVLADVALEPPRRFNEYSGDLSGRYVEALSLLPPDGGADLDGLVQGILGYQRADGRFGNPDLRYTADEIGGQHMAQLWGNGRLLLGLVQYHAVTGDAAALAAARRLADFLTGIRAQASEPAVVARMLDQGAMGIICLTQLNEPLVLLAELTGEARYLDQARQIGATLGPRGTQHAHGYLTTARGMVALAAATGDAALLGQVEALYGDLAGSPDLLYLGGAPEFFGGAREPLRDEGCAVADFLRLSLMLYRATGKMAYLERAERCLLNHLYFNQFSTGDFGHRTFFEQGIAPTESVGRAWWCCTMHGHRAYSHVLDSVVREEDGTVFVDLYLDFDWRGDGLALAARQRMVSPRASRFSLVVREADGASLALRRPSWARSVEVTVDGVPAPIDDSEGYATVEHLQAGDRVELTLGHRAGIETRDGRRLALGTLDGEVEGLLFAGPWLYGVDDGMEPLFFGEPWKGANIITLPADLRSPRSSMASSAFVDPARHIRACYEHGGFTGNHALTLRPVSEQTGREPGTVATWNRYRMESSCHEGEK